MTPHEPDGSQPQRARKTFQGYVLVGAAIAILLAIVLLQDGKAHQEARANDRDDPQLRALLEARRELLKQLVDLEQQEVEVGSEALEGMATAIISLAEAEQEISDNPAERDAFFDKAFEFCNKIERVAESQAKFGQLKAVEVLFARAVALKAKADLKKARLSLGGTEGKASLESTTEMEKSNDAEINRLLRTRYETLKEAAQLTQRQVESGFGSVEMVAQVNNLLLEALLDLPEGLEEETAILEKIEAVETKAAERFQARGRAITLLTWASLLQKQIGRRRQSTCTKQITVNGPVTCGPLKRIRP